MNEDKIWTLYLLSWSLFQATNKIFLYPCERHSIFSCPSKFFVCQLLHCSEGVVSRRLVRYGIVHVCSPLRSGHAHLIAFPQSYTAYSTSSFYIASYGKGKLAYTEGSNAFYCFYVLCNRCHGFCFHTHCFYAYGLNKRLAGP